MITRNEAVSAVLEVFDELDALNAKQSFSLEQQKAEQQRVLENQNKEINNDPEQNKLYDYIFALGSKKLYENVYGSWHSPNAYRDDDGVIKFESLEKFRKGKIMNSAFPEHLSQKEVKEFVESFLIEDYKNTKRDAIEELLEGESATSNATGESK